MITPVLYLGRSYCPGVGTIEHMGLGRFRTATGRPVLRHIEQVNGVWRRFDPKRSK